MATFSPKLEWGVSLLRYPGHLSAGASSHQSLPLLTGARLYLLSTVGGLCPLSLHAPQSVEGSATPGCTLPHSKA